MARDLLWSSAPREPGSFDRNVCAGLEPLGEDPHGDLLAIVRQATSPRLNRRYSTVEHMAADLRRFLALRPVDARRGGLTYRAAKGIRRHKIGLLAGGCAALLFAGVPWWITSANGDSSAAVSDPLTTQRVADYLLGAFAVPAGASDLATRAEALDRMSANVATAFPAEPEAQASLLSAFAWIQLRVGLLERAEENAQRAVRVAVSSLGEDHLLTLRARNVQAAVTLASGRLEEAEDLLREVLARSSDRDSIDWGEQKEPRLLLADVLVEWGRFGEAGSLLHEYVEGASAASDGEAHGRTARAYLLFVTGLTGEASELEQLLLDAHESAVRLQGPAHPQTLSAANELGVFLLNRHGRASEARALLEEAHRLGRDAYGASHPDVLALLHTMAGTLAVEGDLSGALRIAHEAHVGRSATLGPDHPSTLLTLNNIARFEDWNGDWAAALEILESLVARGRAHLPGDHWYVGIFLANYGEALRHNARLFEAEDALREGVQRLERSHDRRSGSVSPLLKTLLLSARTQLGITLEQLGSAREARRLFREVREQRAADLGPEHAATLSAAHNLASALQRSGELEEAERLGREVLTRRAELLGEDHPSTLATQCNLAGTLYEQDRWQAALELNEGLLERALAHAEAPLANEPHYRSSLGVTLASARRFDEAEAQCRAAVEVHAELFGEDHPGRGKFLGELGGVLLQGERYEEALPVLREALAAVVSFLGEDHGLSLRITNDLAVALQKTGNPEEAGELWLDCLERKERLFGPDHRSTLIALNNFAFWLSKQGQTDEATEMYAELVEHAAEVLGESHPETAVYRANFGRCLMVMGRWEEARRELERSARDLVDHHGSPELVPAGCLDHLRQLYRQQGLDVESALASVLED